MEFYLLEVLGMDHEPKHVSTTFWVVNLMKLELLWRRQGSQVQEPLGDTILAARRHTRGAWCVDSRRTQFFILFV